MIRLVASLLSLCAAGAIAATPDEDVERYLQVLTLNTAMQADELEKLSGMGLSDRRLFDAIEKRLLDDAESARRSNIEKNRVAWYFRALGFSGDSKYHATLSRYTEDRTYRNYALNALKDSGDYARWNPIISDRKSFVAGLSDDSNRALNMLRSNDMNLVKIGAKRIYFLGAEDPVLDFLAEQLKARYMIGDPDNADTVAWMVKGLARAGGAKYAPLLEDVRANAPDRQVRNQAAAQLRAQAKR